MCVDQATLVSLECGRVHALFTPVCWKPPNSRAILHQLMPQVSLPLSEGARTPGEAPSRKGPPPLGSLSEFTRHTSSLSHHIVHWRSSLPPIDLRQSHLQRPPAFPLGCMTSILSLQHGHQLYLTCCQSLDAKVHTIGSVHLATARASDAPFSRFTGETPSSTVLR